MKNLTRTLLTGACALLIASSALQSAPIAYEGFDYPYATALSASANTGTGWTTNWDSGSWRTNQPSYTSAQPGGFENAAGLTYTGLSTVGNAARNENDSNQDFRTFASQAATGTYWISFLIQKDAANSGSFGISLFDGGTEKNFMGQASSTLFGVAGAGASVSSTTVTTTPSLFTARYNMDTGIAHFWLNSDLSLTTPTDASAFNGSGGTSFTAFGFDRVRLGKFNGDSGYLDEIRIGTTANDVGFAAVPEPSVFALVGLSVLGLAAHRRRRTA